jgi:DNA polymerase III alpha subunit
LSKTELKDRTLYYDGDTVVSPDRVVEMIEKGLKKIHVTKITDEIKQFNRLSENKITIKDEIRPLKFDWNLPEPYKSWTEQDVVNYIIDRWAEECVLDDNLTDEEVTLRDTRVNDELHLYKDLNLVPILRAIIFVINTLQDKKIVWGVGRGSSVSSYVLYLLGVHDVDSVKYDLDISDFLRRPQGDDNAKESPIS